MRILQTVHGAERGLIGEIVSYIHNWRVAFGLIHDRIHRSALIAAHAQLHSCLKVE